MCSMLVGNGGFQTRDWFHSHIFIYVGNLLKRADKTRTAGDERHFVILWPAAGRPCFSEKTFKHYLLQDKFRWFLVESVSARCSAKGEGTAGKVGASETNSRRDWPHPTGLLLMAENCLLIGNRFNLSSIDGINASEASHSSPRTRCVRSRSHLFGESFLAELCAVKLLRASFRLGTIRTLMWTPKNVFRLWGMEPMHIPRLPTRSLRYMFISVLMSLMV